MRDVPPRSGLGRLAVRAKRYAPIVVAACALLAAPQVLAQGGSQGDSAASAAPGIWDLGTLSAGRVYDTTFSASNASCPGRHDFEIRVEGAPWLRVTGPARLEDVAAGETKSTAAEVDLTGVAPGAHHGTLAIRCLDCPPTCNQDLTTFEVRLVAVADGGGSSGGGTGGGGTADGPPGARFGRFLELADALLVQTSRDALAIAPRDEHARDVLAAYSRFALAPRAEIEQLDAAVQALPAANRSQLDAVVVDGVPEMLATATAGSARAPKLQLQLDGEGNEAVSTVLGKAGELAGSFGPLGTAVKLLLDDVGKLFEGASEMAVMLSGMALAEHELELKLDTLVAGLFGVSIDESSNETELRGLLEQVPSGALPGWFEAVESRLDQVDQRQSVTQHKVDALAHEVGVSLRGVPYAVEPDEPQPEYDGPDPFGDSVLDRVELLRVKIDNLARILGLSLYGPEMGFPQGFDVEPPDPHTTVVVGDGPDYPAIKPEIENLERKSETILDRLKRIEERQGGGPGDGPGDPTRKPPTKIPPDGGTTCCEASLAQLARTKKIYVYDQGTFAATGSGDEKEIVVRTAAFDLAGWLDLTALRDGDAVVATLEVSVAGGPYRPWSRAEFRDAQARGLKSWTELADGLQEVVGTDVRLTLTQPRSADAWQTPVPVGYQLIVESQD